MKPGQGRSRNLHQAADLLHGVFPRPVEVHGVGALSAVEAFASPPFPSSCTRRLQTRLGPLSDERALEFRQCPEDVEDQLPCRRIGVDRLLQAL